MARYMVAVVWTLLMCGSHGLASPQVSPPPRGEQAAGAPGRLAPKPGPTVEIVAKVVRFNEGALFDHHEDGTFARYSATTLEVVSPARLRMRELVVHHEAPVPQESPLRAVGKKLRFRVQASSLDPAIQLFAGALEGIVLQK